MLTGVVCYYPSSLQIYSLPTFIWRHFWNSSGWLLVCRLVQLRFISEWCMRQTLRRFSIHRSNDSENWVPSASSSPEFHVYSVNIFCFQLITPGEQHAYHPVFCQFSFVWKTSCRLLSCLIKPTITPFLVAPQPRNRYSVPTLIPSNFRLIQFVDISHRSGAHTVDP